MTAALRRKLKVLEARTASMRPPPIATLENSWADVEQNRSVSSLLVGEMTPEGFAAGVPEGLRAQVAGTLQKLAGFAAYLGDADCCDNRRLLAALADAEVALTTGVKA